MTAVADATSFYFFAGAPKSGSTFVHREMQRSDQVSCAAGKDVYYFDKFHDRGPDWYARHFDADRPVWADFSHDYLYSREALERIDDEVGDRARVHVILRSPAARTVSALQYHASVGLLARSGHRREEQFDEFAQQSTYSNFLPPLLDVFGPERVRVDYFESFFTDPERSMTDLFEWLDVAPVAVDCSSANEARGSRITVVNTAAKLTAVQLRRWGFGTVVGRLKSSPAVNRLLYRRRPEPIELASDERARLERLTESEAQALGELGFPPPW